MDCNFAANGARISIKVSKNIYGTSSFHQKKIQKNLTSGFRDIGPDISAVWGQNPAVERGGAEGGHNSILGGHTENLRPSNNVCFDPGSRLDPSLSVVKKAVRGNRVLKMAILTVFGLFSTVFSLFMPL